MSEERKMTAIEKVIITLTLFSIVMIGYSSDTQAFTVSKPPVFHISLFNPELPKDYLVVRDSPITPPIVQESPYMGKYDRQYDSYFKSASRRFLPHTHWLWLKAICYQESLLIKDAVSYVGAQGLCQFMPGTWSDMEERMGWNNVSAFDPKLNIMASAYYNATLMRQWSAPRPLSDKKALTNASYNAGLGNILKAQKLCNNKSLYDEIIYCLPMVTGHHANETKTYVLSLIHI